MDPGLYELIRAGDRQDEVAVIMRLDRETIPEGARIISQLGPIATARIKRESIEAVHAQEGVFSVKAPRFYSPDLVSTATAEAYAPELLPSDERRPKHLTETGKGVVVALIDWGFDFAHPDFRNRDGSSRIIALWDQRGRRGGVSNNRYGYGWIHDRQAINAALRTQDPYATLSFHPADAGRGPTHGTHTAGIAGGGGFSKGPAGMAPQCHFVLVHLATATGERGNHIGDSAALVEATDFVFKAAGSMPCVLSLSMGCQAGPHDGKTLTELALDAALASAPGRACVQSTGNYFSRPIHTRGVLRPGEVRDIQFHSGRENGFQHEIEIWYPGRDRITVELIAPSGGLAAQARTGQQADLLFSGFNVGRLYNRRRDPNNHDNVAHIYLDAAAPRGSWTLRLRGVDVVDGRFHCWIERDPNCASCQPGFDHDEIVPTSTTGTICNGYLTVAVGAYDAHDPKRPLAPFSSSGLTRDNRFKPDIVAPGVDVLSAHSTPRPAVSNPPLLARMSGTSMAAPYVAGVVALMFEAAGRLLPVRRTRELLLKVSEPLGEEEPQERWGSGYVNVLEAVAAAREEGARPARRCKVQAHASEDTHYVLPGCKGIDEEL